MSLPSVAISTFDATIPSTKDKVSLRTYLVKEEKLFLMAQESQDMNVAFSTLRQVLSACSFGKLNLDKLAIFDFEYLFLQLRAESVGAEVKTAFRCQNMVQVGTVTHDSLAEDAPPPSTEPIMKKCDKLVHFTINLRDVNVHFPEGHTSNIQLDDNLWVKMRYPHLGEAALELTTTENVTASTMGVVASCVDMVYTAKESWDRTQLTNEQVLDFLDNLRPPHFKAIQNFFVTMPRLRHVLDFKCPACSYEQPIVLEGMESFFL
jgi:hypothetical protein